MKYTTSKLPQVVMLELYLWCTWFKSWTC